MKTYRSKPFLSTRYVIQFVDNAILKSMKIRGNCSAFKINNDFLISCCDMKSFRATVIN